MYMDISYNLQIYMAHSPCFYSPLLAPLVSPLYSLLLTWNPPSCDRIRPPWSQVACELTSLVPPFTQPSPLQIPRTPTGQRLTKTTSGIIWHLLSETGLLLRTDVEIVCC
jgi:hypothetical protein